MSCFCYLPSVPEIEEQASRVQAAISQPIAPAKIADSLAAVLERWRDRAFARRRETVAQNSRRLGFSIALLDESLDALLAPFTREALNDLANRIVTRRELLGFVMAGNAAGAGLHEIAIALLAGAGLIIKTASREPFFFDEFARTLAEENPAIGGRVSVLNWSRDNDDLVAALRADADLIVAYGDDATISRLGGSTAIIGFGSKLSGAVVMRSALLEPDASEIAARLARDVTLFEQLGCLSPHHVFVESERESDVRKFAATLADAMRALAEQMPPPSDLELEDAAVLRRVREIARWRAIAGDPVEVIEGPGLSWVVIVDRDASFSASPGLRCVNVSMFRDCGDLRARLVPAAGRLEAFAIAGDGEEAIRAVPGNVGVSYIAAPGAMQSPPLTWRHGGGAFLDRMTARR
ncbi:MAG: acyl-CoA reductase [Candidatus Binataceae bacterium]